MREDKCQHSMSDTDAWQYMYWNSQRTGTEQDAYIVPRNEKEIYWKNLDLVKKLHEYIQRKSLMNILNTRAQPWHKDNKSRREQHRNRLHKKPSMPLHCRPENWTIQIVD